MGRRRRTGVAGEPHRCPQDGGGGAAPDRAAGPRHAPRVRGGGRGPVAAVAPAPADPGPQGRGRGDLRPRRGASSSPRPQTLTADALVQHLAEWRLRALAELERNDPDSPPGPETDNDTMSILLGFGGRGIIQADLTPETYALLVEAVEARIETWRKAGHARRRRPHLARARRRCVHRSRHRRLQLEPARSAPPAAHRHRHARRPVRPRRDHRQPSGTGGRPGSSAADPSAEPRCAS